MPGDQQPGKPPPKPRGLMPVVIAFVAMLLFVLYMSTSMRTEWKQWSEFISEIEQGKVAEIEHGRSHATVRLEDKKAKPAIYNVHYPYGKPPTDRQLEELFAAIQRGNTARANRPEGAKNPIIEDGAPPESPWGGFLIQLLVFGLIIFAVYFLIFRRMGQGGGVLSFGKSRATLITKNKTGKTFKDVAGIDEAKEEVEELVAFLRHPRKFQKLGGRIPRGVMLVGPPGTGKTLLARAIAGEADVPFYTISGSDFVEMFVGVGASRVRDLFQQAKDNSPCIIFIDEIDAVARKRGSGISSGGHDEREQTLNAILVEMDGFASNDKVIVIAATNRVDVLDPALLRPGRFDRHIYVDLPDIAGREQILSVHSSKVKLSPQVDLSVIARGTPGFSGADLENLINEAALNAARYDKDAVEHEDLEYARDRVAFGREKKKGSRSMTEDERRMTAYHEAGHAIIQHLLPECDDLHKVTIVPRGRFLGASMSLPKDRHSMGRKKLMGDICVAFGGRIAEEKFCDDVTTGAKQDIEQATRYARAMVYQLGMSDKMGPMAYTEDHAGWGGTEQVIAVSEQTRRELDEEVRAILDGAYKRAQLFIDENRDALERVAEGLLEYETLDAAQVQTLIDGGELEPRVPTVTIPKVKPDDEPVEEATESSSDPDVGGIGPLEPKPA